MEPLRNVMMKLGGAALDTPADGEHCSHAHAASAAGAVWPPAAARVVPPRCTPGSR